MRCVLFLEIAISINIYYDKNNKVRIFYCTSYCSTYIMMHLLLTMSQSSKCHIEGVIKQNVS